MIQFNSSLSGCVQSESNLKAMAKGIFFFKKRVWGSGCSSVVECWPSTQEVLVRSRWKTMTSVVSTWRWRQKEKFEITLRYMKGSFTFHTVLQALSKESNIKIT